MSTLYEALSAAVESASGIGVRATLATLDGDRLVLPPTYADVGHNTTAPREDGSVERVSIDSPASFANRVEEQLRLADLGLDPLRVQVAGRTLSTLQLPHRVFDAVLRDAVDPATGAAFGDTAVGQAVAGALASDASAMLRYDPAVLLLGAWNSTGLLSGGRGAKFAAVLSAELYGSDAISMKRAGNRVDPLGIEGTSPCIVVMPDGSWHFASEQEMEDIKEKTPKKDPPYRVKPSEINHANILSLMPKGMIVRGDITLTGSLSLQRLRRYGGLSNEDRVFIAAMGIYGVAAVIANGLDLRRDCELVADEVRWFIRAPGSTQDLAVSADDAREALRTARSKVTLAEPMTFKANASLEELVERGC